MTLMGGMTEGLEDSWRVKNFVSRSFNRKERRVIEAVRSRTMEGDEKEQHNGNRHVKHPKRGSQKQT